MAEGNVKEQLPFDAERDLPFEPPKVMWEEKLEVGPTLAASNIPATIECGPG